MVSKEPSNLSPHDSQVPLPLCAKAFSSSQKSCAFLRSTLISFPQSFHLFSFLRTNLLMIKSHFCTHAMEYKNVGYRMQRCPVHSICYYCSVTKSCLTLCDPMDYSMPGCPVHHQLPEFTQTHVYWVGDAIQPSHPLSSPSPSVFNLSQHQDLFQWVSSLHQVANVLELQLQYQSFQWTPRTDLLYDGLVGSPCSPRDSQESSPTPQFKSITSSVLSFLYGSTLI